MLRIPAGRYAAHIFYKDYNAITRFSRQIRCNLERATGDELGHGRRRNIRRGDPLEALLPSQIKDFAMNLFVPAASENGRIALTATPVPMIRPRQAQP